MARPPAVRACVGCDTRHRPIPRRAGLASVTHRTHPIDSVWGCTVPPSVVLVTGVSKFLGGYLAARLAADPAIDRVLGVDTVPPPRDLLRRMGRAEFVRADIRNPLIAKVISQASVDTVVHASLAANPASSGGRTAMKEMNVIGTMQLLAACQKAPSGAAGRAEVHHRRLRLQLARPGPVRRGDDAEGLPVGRLRQGRRRDRGVPARVRPPPSRRLGHRPALRQPHRPAHRHRLHPLLRAAGRAHGARLRRPRAAPARGGRARRAGARDAASSCPARSTSLPTAC